ncbi:hypothetical protein RIF29_14690 [Crotalaria pallida]|uniref:C2H2-type domain-containing protein n=1 Tax=Crotalaria pallida TaxID=3830 RepID=A0AAN9FKL5_CROPI
MGMRMGGQLQKFQICSSLQIKMAAASSTTPFFGIRQETQSQITQLQPSTDGSSTAASTTTMIQKKRRNHPGTPYPDAEVIALSPKTLMATNRFICEVCNKGFQREQNLQLHRRGHNLPWKLKQKSTKEPKRKVYLCPEPTCVHHDPSRALGDLTGIKKHYSRKHGEKKWKCDKCSKKYAVQSDWKAHSKTCGTREYRCDCGTLFSRRDSFITHRAFCDALAHETAARHPTNLNPLVGTHHHLYGTNHMSLSLSQVGTQISQLQNHNQQGTTNNSILSLGNNVVAPKFEHLMSPLHHHHHSSYGVVQSPHSMSSSGYFMTEPNQGFQELQSPQGTISNNNKQQLYGLMQLPDHQGNTNTNNNNSTSAHANMFNLSFFTNSNSSGSMIPDQFNSISGGGNQGATLYTSKSSPVNNHQEVGSGNLSSLFGNSSVQQESMSPHMSATALLQKAAQMGSTTATSASSMLRGLAGSSSANGAESFGSDSRGEGIRSNIENDQQHHLQGLMNSIANGNNSIFGNVKGNENNLAQFHNVEENNNKLSQNHGVCFGGSDKLTLDFLGVGGLVRNMSDRFSQREQQQQSMGSMSSLDPKLESAHANQPFGSSTLH